MTDARKRTVEFAAEFREADGELRRGQLIANLATLAHHAKAETVWGAADEELIASARRLLAHYRGRQMQDQIAGRRLHRQIRKSSIS